MKPRDPKQCTKCKAFKPRTDFYARPMLLSPGCITPRCKDCEKDHARKHRATLDKRQEWKRKRDLKEKYGLTLADYDNILSLQNGRCAICETATPKGKGRFHVDHCHKTGVVRGLLCHHCNVALGCMKDDTQRLAKAIVYLDEKGLNLGLGS